MAQLAAGAECPQHCTVLNTWWSEVAGDLLWRRHDLSAYSDHRFPEVPHVRLRGHTILETLYPSWLRIHVVGDTNR